MAQLLIQSRGIAPVESFTLLGASLSRNEDGLIGQFGSGSKLAITTLLRKGLTVNIYCGLTRLEFKTKTISISDEFSTKQERQVFIQFHGSSRKKLDLGWTLGFGAMDWQNENMACRELISNAIDHTVKGGQSVRDAFTDRDLAVTIVPDEQMKAQANYTRIFIEANDVCEAYVDDLHRHFLHFSRTDLGNHILPKLSDRKKAQIYFQGVFVCEMTNSDDSLCDYNFTGDQIKIDESRNLDSYTARAAIGRLYRDASVDDLVTLLTAVKRGVDCLETGLDSFYLTPLGSATEKQNETWQEAWQQVNGDAIACGDDDGIVGDFARRKGHTLAVVRQSGMLDAAKSYGIATVGTVLDDNERQGRTLTAPTFEAIDAVNEVWGWITSTDLIDEEKCPKPTVKGFDEISNAESDCLGFWKPGERDVYLRNDLAGDMLLETALEEVTHYVTGAGDCSRDIQSFAFRLLVRWMK
jgi:hypothetical protein